MNFIEELTWRGMLHDATPGVEEQLNKEKTVAYIGFDPTAPALTIGNYVQIMLLKLFQLSGHQPIVLMGGATGRIGDPSGKDKERTLKTGEELDYNLASQQKHFYKFLDFEGVDNPAIVVNNLDFYKDMNVLDFLRDVGKNLTVNYMLSKDSVKNRLESGLSFTEFSYQLLQAYDFLALYRSNGCRLQMGGSDQWGNITSGTEFIRRNVEGGKAYAITTPLLTKADGSKFGKSEAGNIWLDASMTSPYKFYQFWINADDRDIPKFIRYFTLKSRAEVESLEEKYAENPRGLKAILAEELTVRIHGQQEFEAVQSVSEILFNKKASKEQLLNLSLNAFQAIQEEIPAYQVSRSKITDGINIVELLAAETNIVASNGDARRAIKGNAISINKEKVSNHNTLIANEHLILDRYIMVENGKKNKYLLEAN